jgi:prophage maintenance system killer protein
MYPLHSELPLEEACSIASDELYRSILGFHEYALLRDGGSPGIRLQSDLAAATHRPFTYAGNDFAFPNGLLQAAVLVQSLAQGHLFIDANKRTAFITCLYFLTECRYWRDAPIFHVEELAHLEDMILRLARQNEDIQRRLIQRPYTIDDIASSIHEILAVTQRRSILTFRPARLAKGTWRMFVDLLLGRR